MTTSRRGCGGRGLWAEIEPKGGLLGFVWVRSPRRSGGHALKAGASDAATSTAMQSCVRTSKSNQETKSGSLVRHKRPGCLPASTIVWDASGSDEVPTKRAEFGSIRQDFPRFGRRFNMPARPRCFQSRQP
jgi:hypothetical protein